MPLDPNLKALLTVPVDWEQYTGQDLYADESYAPVKQLLCRLEARSLIGGDVTATRTSVETELLPSVRMYFDADDADVQSFSLRDRFTVPGIAGGERKQVLAIDPIYGPAGDAWLVAVSL